MVKILTSLELAVVVRELQQLVGSKVSKIHQTSTRVLVLNLFKTGGDKFLLKIDSGVGMYATSFTSPSPLIPLSFCLFLRKHLNNSKLVSIKQKNLERIIELHFDTKDGLRILICELFSKGNFVLCDSAYKILNCASVQQWKGRTIKKGETYKYPPESFNLQKLDQTTFQEYLNKHKEHEIVKLIATLGFGGTYAEEICLRAEIQKNTAAQMLRAEEVNAIYSQTQNLLSQFRTSSAELIYEDDTSEPKVPHTSGSKASQGEQEQAEEPAAESSQLTAKEEKPKKDKKSFLHTKKGQIILGVIAVLFVLYATFFAASPKNPQVFGLQPTYLIFALSIILSIFVTLVYKYLTDQTLMRELKKDLKKYQKQMKEARSDHAKMSEISKKSMAVNMKYMHQSMKPMLFTLLPFLGIFTWLRSVFDSTVIFALPFWPHTLGWIGTYIIFSMVFTTVFRKLMNVV